MPIAVVCTEVAEPETVALTVGLMCRSTMPWLVAAPLPAMVRLESVNDFVRFVPSTRTASPLALLMDHGPITYGLLAVPAPLTTHAQVGEVAIGLDDDRRMLGAARREGRRHEKQARGKPDSGEPVAVASFAVAVCP